MSARTETWSVWAGISERVAAEVRRTVWDQVDAQDVFCEIRFMFLNGDHGAGYTPGQALNYCLRYLKKQALRQLKLVSVRRTIGSRGAYATAVGGTEREAELQEIEDRFHPYVDFVSYEELISSDSIPEAWNSCCDPLNPSGYDDRILEYLESPLVNEAAKKMARMMLQGYTQREVAAALGTSEQTVQRHLCREAVKLESRTAPPP